MISEAQFLGALRVMPGVVRAEFLDRAAALEVADTEFSITRVSGGMRVDNRGVLDCVERDCVAAVFCDSTFSRPCEITMTMVSDDGVVVGHDVPPAMMHMYRDRRDVVWMAEGFVMYPHRVGRSDVTMVMGSSRLKVPGLPSSLEVRMFYPSLSSAELLNARFGMDGEGIASALVGADLLSSCDRCDGGSRTTGPPW